MAGKGERAPDNGTYTMPNSHGRFRVGKGQLMPPGATFRSKDAPALTVGGRPGLVSAENRGALLTSADNGETDEAAEARKRASTAKGIGTKAGKEAYAKAIADGKTQDEANTIAAAAAKDAADAYLAGDAPA